MRISDWSSDVCSSDLVGILRDRQEGNRDDARQHDEDGDHPGEDRTVDEEVRHCRATLLGDGGRRLLAALPRLRIDLGAGTDILDALYPYELAGPEALPDVPDVASPVARLHSAPTDRPVRPAGNEPT